MNHPQNQPFIRAVRRIAPRLRAILCLPLLMLPAHAQSVSSLGLEQSTNLQDWQPIPVTPEMLDANGRIVVPSETAGCFYRLQLDLLSAPAISTQPTSAGVVAGSTASLSVEASGEGLSYQWYFGESGDTSQPIAGATSASYTTDALSETSSYWVRVSNAGGSVDSDTVVVAVTPPVSAEMVLIPGGSFTMGRTSGDGFLPAPVTVTVSGFYMGKHEVTCDLYERVRQWANSRGYGLPAATGKGGDHPAILDWIIAVTWCNARSEMEGLTPCYSDPGTGTFLRHYWTAHEPLCDWSVDGYRLPTEAEWEKAARGGVAGSRFPTGKDTITHGDANYYSVDYIPFDVSLTKGFHPAADATENPGSMPVGSFAANGYGLHDMAGNVQEWCWDLHTSNFASYTDGATDPRGPDRTSGGSKVLRGGSWTHRADFCRCAARFDGDTVGTTTGWRVVRGTAGN